MTERLTTPYSHYEQSPSYESAEDLLAKQQEAHEKKIKQAHATSVLGTVAMAWLNPAYMVHESVPMALEPEKFAHIEQHIPEKDEQKMASAA